MITGIHILAGGSFYDYYPTSVAEANDPDWKALADDFDKFFSELVKNPSDSGYSIEQLFSLYTPQFTPITFLDNLAKDWNVPSDDEVLARRQIRDGLNPGNSGDFIGGLENILPGRTINIYPANVDTGVIWGEDETWTNPFYNKTYYETRDSLNIWPEGFDDSIFVDIGQPAPTTQETLLIIDYLNKNPLLGFDYYVGYIDSTNTRQIYFIVSFTVQGISDPGISLI